MACGNFCKNRKIRFFGMISKFNFRSPVWQIFTIYSACFIYGILNTPTKILVSKSKTVVTREWSRKGSKYICLQSLESKLYWIKIFLKNSFWRHLPSTTVGAQSIARAQSIAHSHIGNKIFLKKLNFWKTILTKI